MMNLGPVIAIATSLVKTMDRIMGPSRRIAQSVNRVAQSVNIRTVQALEMAGELPSDDEPARFIIIPFWACYLQKYGFLKIEKKNPKPYNWLANQLLIYRLWDEYDRIVCGSQLKVFLSQFRYKGDEINYDTIRTNKSKAPNFSPTIQDALQKIYFEHGEL